MNKLKKLFPLVIAAVLVAVCLSSLFGSAPEHIEDTNGADNYALQQINNYNIINMDIGAVNLDERTELTSELPVYKSDKYTGVSEIYSSNITGNRFDITIYNLWVESGNFKLVLVQDDEIVHEFKNNELSQSFTLDNPNGYISLRIAGESACFEFSYDLI